MAGPSNYAEADSVFALRLHLLENGAGHVKMSTILDLPQLATPDLAHAYNLADVDRTFLADAALARNLALSEVGCAPCPSKNVCPSTSAMSPNLCPICMEQVALSVTFHTPCGHDFCEPCIRTHFVTIATERQQYPLRCPTCRGELEPMACLALLAGSGLPYIALSKLILEKEHHTSLSYCSNTACATPFDFEDNPESAILGDRFRVRCPICGGETCVKCRTVWHKGLSCGAAVLKLRDADAVAQLDRLARANQWKPCPRCNHLIERQAGDCYFLRCRCGCGFCHRCGNAYLSMQRTTGNSHGQPNCSCGLFPHENANAPNAAAAARPLPPPPAERLPRRPAQPGLLPAVPVGAKKNAGLLIGGPAPVEALVQDRAIGKQIIAGHKPEQKRGQQAQQHVRPAQPWLWPAVPVGGERANETLLTTRPLPQPPAERLPRRPAQPGLLPAVPVGAKKNAGLLIGGPTPVEALVQDRAIVEQIIAGHKPEQKRGQQAQQHVRPAQPCLRPAVPVGGERANETLLTTRPLPPPPAERLPRRPAQPGLLPAVPVGAKKVNAGLLIGGPAPVEALVQDRAIVEQIIAGHKPEQKRGQQAQQHVQYRYSAQEAREQFTHWVEGPNGIISISNWLQGAFRKRLPSRMRGKLGQNRCPYLECMKMFPNSESLEHHLADEQLHEVWLCCGRPFQNREGWNHHREAVHAQK